MDKRVLDEAVENISLIKGVINQTSKSFAGFSRIFIYWGLLFILNSIIHILMTSNQEQMLDISIRYPILSYIFPVGIIVLIAVLIYRNISSKIPLIGLEKHLMKIWILILVMNSLPKRINIIQTTTTAIDMSTVSIETNHFSAIIFSLAIALIMTSLFTGYKQLKFVGVGYISISILYAYFNVSIFSGSLIQFLQLIALPATFLYTGFFLKSQQTRVN